MSVEMKSPQPPRWVQKSEAATRAWYANFAWRCNAVEATTAQYKRILIRDAERMYQ